MPSRFGLARTPPATVIRQLDPTGAVITSRERIFLLVVAVSLALAVTGCERPGGRKSMWNIVAEMQGDDHAFIAAIPSSEPPPRALKAVKDADMPCLKTCHERGKWATGKPYPHLHEQHKDNGKHCVDCHALGHRSAKADRKVCKDCH